MTRPALLSLTAVVVSISLACGCSSPNTPTDAPTELASDTLTDAGLVIDSGQIVDAAIDINATDSAGEFDTAVAPDASDATVRDAIVRDTVDVTSDSSTASLDWYPGNYGLVDSSNSTARDAFLRGPLAGPFEGVEMVYSWSMCETALGNYDACFAAIDADLAALPAGKHLIIFLQYKAFGTGPGINTVPPYLRTGPGAWCVTSGGTPICGQYPTPNGMIAMIWNDAVATRMHAWFAAIGAYYGPGGPGASRGNRIAGVVLPETASGQNATHSLTSVGYTAANYIDAIEANLLSLTRAFPTKPVFQYINFIAMPTTTESAALQSIGDWALVHPNVGLGCPDVGGNSTFSPPGYNTLMNPRYQLHLPFNVAIENMDFDSAYTTGLPATYAEATRPAPAGMAAQFVVWMHVQGAGHVFNIDDVAAYLPMHPNPNTALPTY